MFKKKIIASVLIGSLAFGLFPVNIFANNSLIEAERKICENKDLLTFFEADGNDLFALFDKDVKGDFSIKYPHYMTKNGIKIGENYHSDSYNGSDGIWNPPIKVVNGNFYDITDDYNGIKNGENFTGEIPYDKDEPVTMFNRIDLEEYNLEIKDDGIYKNGNLFISTNGFPIIIDIIGNDIYYRIYENNKYYKNNEELQIPKDSYINFILENGEIIYNEGNNFYKNGKLFGTYNKYEEGGSYDEKTIERVEFKNGNDIYGAEYDVNTKNFKIFKNLELVSENNISNIKLKKYIVYGKEFNLEDYRYSFSSINSNGDIYSFFSMMGHKHSNDPFRGPSFVLKNGKPLCENLENNNGNSGNQNSSNQNSSGNSGSTPASSSNITIKNDERVIGSENTVKTVKSEDKNENKKEDLKSKTFTENEKNDVKDLVSNIIKKYSQSKDTLDSIYKALTTREDIKKMAENNPRIKFVIEEFTKQYIIFSVGR